MTSRPCRFCGAQLEAVFVDLGMSPPSNALVTQERLTTMERFYPLRVYVCGTCFLVQLEEFESPSDIFSDYAYFSSYSTSWLEQCKRYANMIAGELKLGPAHRVVEIASNDGYLLQYFREIGVPVLGVEPAANVAKVAVERGVPTEVAFFGTETARRLRGGNQAANLIVGNNVLAHVPDINDFVEGVRILLEPGGTVTFEFPHLLQLIAQNQFDTIYHEHFSYLSALTVSKIFAAHGLRIVRIDEVPTHGGSLRVWAAHEDDSRAADSSVERVLSEERAFGLDRLEAYASFEESTRRAKRGLLRFLIDARERGERVVAYGAAAKGTTLLNYCGVRVDLIDYVVDRSPHKQGRYLPGCHVPIFDPARVAETRPDYLLILPWNIKDEIVEQMAHIREWGGRFVVPIPNVEIL
ncbi:MAG: class I SAM-dependent methyltransferase [Candidatus Eremiobacteraeota bacterium]|nr:class I SAM-dependent methyltransferase [Candidatus Eremiobacteraeota bacterium]